MLALATLATHLSDQFDPVASAVEDQVSAQNRWELPTVGEPVVTIEISSVRYPSVAEFVRREAASSPLAGPLGSLDRDVRETLLEDVEEALHDYIDDQGVVIPLESHVLLAER